MVSINACPMSISTPSSAFPSPLSHILEHQTQSPTPVTPPPLLRSPYPFLELSYPPTDTSCLKRSPECGTSDLRCSCHLTSDARAPASLARKNNKAVTPMPANNSGPRQTRAIEPRHRPPGQREIMGGGVRVAALLAHAR